MARQIIRLTESDLKNIIKRILREQEDVDITPPSNPGQDINNYGKCVQGFGKPKDTVSPGAYYIEGNSPTKGTVFFKGFLDGKQYGKVYIKNSPTPAVNQWYYCNTDGQFVITPSEPTTMSAATLPTAKTVFAGGKKRVPANATTWDPSYVMGLGSQGHLVKMLQHHMAKSDWFKNDEEIKKYTGNVACKTDINQCDGRFGANMDEIVKKYQQEFGLKVDGQVGDQTWDYMVQGGMKEGE